MFIRSITPEQAENFARKIKNKNRDFFYIIFSNSRRKIKLSPKLLVYIGDSFPIGYQYKELYNTFKKYGIPTRIFTEDLEENLCTCNSKLSFCLCKNKNFTDNTAYIYVEKDGKYIPVNIAFLFAIVDAIHSARVQLSEDTMMIINEILKLNIHSLTYKLYKSHIINGEYSIIEDKIYNDDIDYDEIQSILEKINIDELSHLSFNDMYFIMEFIDEIKNDNIKRKLYDFFIYNSDPYVRLRFLQTLSQVMIETNFSLLKKFINDSEPDVAFEALQHTISHSEDTL